MAEAMVERQSPRFYCYKCNVEFDHISQDFLCPYCSGGFVEQLEAETSTPTPLNTSEIEADMIAIEDPDDASLEDPGHGLTDLAFLMSNGRIRGVRGGINLGNTENLLQHILMAWSGDVGQSAPVVVVGTSPGDYVVGGESFDAVVTQLLGQLEGSGPPPLSADCIAAIPTIPITEEQAEAKTTCAICWEAFNTGESVRRLACEHLYHGPCIEPWLKLHGTCPVCRRSLLPERPEGAPPDAPRAAAQPLPPHPPHAHRTFRTYVEGSRDIPPRLTALLMRAARGGAGGRAPRSTRMSTGGAGPPNAARAPRPRGPPDAPHAPAPDADAPTAGYSMDIDFD